MTESAEYRKALAERSSYVEYVLVHRMVANLAGELWRRDPITPLQIFNSEVDDSGFDLVLGCGSKLRYIQVKQVHTKGAASKFSVRLDFTRMHGSRVVVVVHTEDELLINHFLFYGGMIHEPMPSVEDNKPSITPGQTRQRRQPQDPAALPRCEAKQIQGAAHDSGIARHTLWRGARRTNRTTSMLTLKTYQLSALTVLTQFLADTRSKPVTEAYSATLATQNRIGEIYHPLFGDIPCVCLRVPTGGGKTIMAAHAVALAGKAVLDSDAPIALWLTPSDTICT